MSTTAAQVEADALDRELDLGRIADLLSELSQPCELPTAAEPSDEPSPFNPEEVDFASNDWVQKTLSIQCWLRLDSVISLTAPAGEIAQQLFMQLERERPSDCYTIDGGGNIKLTPLGVQQLEDRLSRAAGHKQAYTEALDLDRSVKDASAEWLQNWEEYEAPPRPPISINAAVAQWRIKDFRDNAKEGLLDLNPSYQRDIVWSNAESQVLIESILRGIPLPSVILSQGTGADQRKWQIVDGKQRLTAILRFIGQHPDGRAYAKTAEGGLELFEQNFKKFARKNHLKPALIAENFLPFKLRTFATNDPLAELSGKYYYEIKDKVLRIGGEDTTIADAFESISSPYQIPVLLYRNTQIHDIHHVFGLYNKQGKKLNAEELRNAVYHHVNLMRLLLVLSGDRPAPDKLAPYLPEPSRVGIEELGALLKEYNFGTNRFKRTKVLCWMSAMLLQKPNENAGLLTTPSTASHINAMLDSAEKQNPSNPLSKEAGLVEFARVVDAAIHLHRDCENAWASAFRNKKGNASKWEELPLVGSLLACVILESAGAAHLLQGRVQDVRTLSETLKSPEKTQNKTQWRHIALIATKVLKLLAVDHGAAGDALQRKYGYNCLPVLERLSA